MKSCNKKLIRIFTENWTCISDLKINTSFSVLFPGRSALEVLIVLPLPISLSQTPKDKSTKTI